MQKHILPGILGVFLAFYFHCAAYAQGKVDPFFGVVPPAIGTNGPAKAMILSRPNYEAFIKSLDVQATRLEVEALGGTVKMVTGQILSVSIPEDIIPIISELEDVIYVEAAKPIGPRNDLALTDLNANEVHDGILLSAPYTGRDTIVGIVDTGIDYSHPDFKDADGRNRILYIWDQGDGSGIGPGELESTYGTECDSDDIIGGTCQVRDRSGHGTHVAGTAAGRHEKYKGIAPNSSVIAVRYKSELEIDGGYANPIFSTTICEAAYYIFKKAEQLGLPAVVNLSLGTHLGPHDGTSLFEECLDSLVEGTAGRALVAAVGNEHSNDDFYTGLHAGYDVSGTLKATNFEVRSLTAGRVFYIDVWGDHGSNLNFGLALNENKGSTPKLLATSGMIRPGASKSGSFLAGKITYQVNNQQTASPLNGKPHVGITMIFRDDMGDTADYNFDLLVSGEGHFDAWLYPDKPADIVNFTSYQQTRPGISWTYVAGDRQMSIATPATAKNVIAVAAYTTRNNWDCCQVNYALGDILNFSSRGPTADEDATGHKPEIAAPGAMIASAKSLESPTDQNFIMDDGQHILMAGSSMAVPFVSGTVALIFSMNPDFTHEDAKRFIIESAYVDDLVGTVPNYAWGYGKLDVLGALEVATGRQPSGGYASNPSVDLPDYNQPAQSGGCQLIYAPLSPINPAILLMFSLFALSALLIVRRHHIS